MVIIMYSRKVITGSEKSSLYGVQFIDWFTRRARDMFELCNAPTLRGWTWIFVFLAPSPSLRRSGQGLIEIWYEDDSGLESMM